MIALAEEQQLVDKYVALASGEIMNTYNACSPPSDRGNVLGNGNTAVADGEDKEAFYRPAR